MGKPEGRCGDGSQWDSVQGGRRWRAVGGGGGETNRRDSGSPSGLGTSIPILTVIPWNPFICLDSFLNFREVPICRSFSLAIKRRWTLVCSVGSLLEGFFFFQIQLGTQGWARKSAFK